MVHLSGRKLNLGCGFDKRAGYVNVDMQASQNPDVVADVVDLREFPSRYYEEILSLGVIEHFKRKDTRRALYEWNRLLVPGGVLEFSTTYLNGLVRKLEAPSLQSIEGQELIVETLFAGQVCEGDYHLTAFSEPLLRYYLWECGFAVADLRLRDGWLFEVTARKETDYSFVELVAGAFDDAAFLNRACEAILFRGPGDAEREQYGTALRQGRLTRRQVIGELLSGEERKRRMIAQAPRFVCVFHARMGLCGESEDAEPEVQARRLPHWLLALAGKGRSALGRLRRKMGRG